MAGHSLKFHAGRMVLAIAGILLVAWISGHPIAVLGIALALYLSWHVLNFWRLYSLLKNPRRKPPDSLGLWAAIFDRIDSMNKRNRKQKKRYRSMIADFRNVTDAFPDATLIIDSNSNLVWFNSAGGRLLGHDPKRLIGRPVKNLIRSTEFTDWLAGRTSEANILATTLHDDDSAWFNVTSVPIRRKRRMIIFRDISDVLGAEQMRKDFVTNISHELRTPLTVMRGYLELMLDRPEDELTDAVERMHAQALQMQSMLDDLLELSRLQEQESQGQEQRVDVPAMLLKLKKQAEEISRGNHQLQFDIDSGLFLSGVESDLESAFMNLIVNAVKYTPAGGTVAVNWQNSETGAVLTVSDTGIGIPQREIARLTERFYRVGSDRGRKTGGTGLGLAIVKHVLNRHQARLDIESDYGVGSKFSCIFPPERKSA